MIKTEKTKKSKCYIPKFYSSKIDFLGLENYKLVSDSDGNQKLYVSPIVRTIVSDMKNQIPKGQESLARTIKEKMCPNFRMLLKNAIQKSIVTYINGRQFVLVNGNISRHTDNVFIIMNDNSWKKSKTV